MGSNRSLRTPRIQSYSMSKGLKERGSRTKSTGNRLVEELDDDKDKEVEGKLDDDKDDEFDEDEELDEEEELTKEEELNKDELDKDEDDLDKDKDGVLDEDEELDLLFLLELFSSSSSCMDRFIFLK